MESNTKISHNTNRGVDQAGSIPVCGSKNKISIKMEILNNFNKTITKSQQKWLNRIVKEKGEKIINISLTRAGWISVDFKRESKEYPFGREIRGLRGGWISSLQGKEYDFENGWIMNGVVHDHVTGIGRFTLE